MFRRLIIIVLVISLVVTGCDNNNAAKSTAVKISVNDEVLVELTKRNEPPLAASSVEIFVNAIELLQGSDYNLYNEYCETEGCFYLPQGTSIVIKEIKGEYVKFLILDEDFHNGEVAWTYKKYLEEY